jgi:iron complex outermembrane receptor protein
MKQKLVLNYLLLIILLTVFIPNSILLAEDEILPEDLTTIGLDALMNIDMRVTTATRRSQKVSSVPAAVYVLTSDDIKRSGVRHLAEALRMAPGVEVARVSGNRWSVSIRGFNQQYSAFCLVLLDGRPIFTPLFSGVFWETLDVPIEIVDRIEVVRGPGSSVWGANAVNGVISITTKQAKENLGTLFATGGGNQEKYFHRIINGGKISDDTYYRVSHQHSVRDENIFDSTRTPASDRWRISSLDFRLDSDISNSEKFTFLSNSYYESDYLPVSNPTLSPPYFDNQEFSAEAYNSGTNLSTRYESIESQDVTNRFNFDYIFETREGKVLPLTRHALNFEGLRESKLNDSLDFIGGVGYRVSFDNTEGNALEELIPESRVLNLVSGFAQLQQSLFNDKVSLLGGLKTEYFDIGGFQLMPTVRALWTPQEGTSTWVAYSQGASNQGRILDNLKLPIQYIPSSDPSLPGTMVTAFGNQSSLSPTKLTGVEAGIRQQIGADLFVDLTGFSYEYDNVFGFEPGNPFLGNIRDINDPLFIFPLEFGNSYSANSHGAEISIDAALSDRASISGFYTLLNLNVNRSASGLDSETLLKEGNSPQSMSGIRGRFTLAEGLTLDPSLRYVDSLKYGNIPSYWQLGTRLGWKYNKNLEFVLSGQDLIGGSHLENQGTIFAPQLIRIEKSIWAEVIYTF